MTFTLCLLAFIGIVVGSGLLFSFFHPNKQGWGEGLPNESKRHFDY
jgi:hypothetical protein